MATDLATDVATDLVADVTDVATDLVADVADVATDLVADVADGLLVCSAASISTHNLSVTSVTQSVATSVIMRFFSP